MKKFGHGHLQTMEKKVKTFFIRPTASSPAAIALQELATLFWRYLRVLTDRLRKSSVLAPRKGKPGRRLSLPALVFVCLLAGCGLISLIQRTTAQAAPALPARSASSQVKQTNRNASSQQNANAPNKAAGGIFSFPCSYTTITQGGMQFAGHYVDPVTVTLRVEGDANDLRTDWLTGDKGRFMYTLPTDTYLQQKRSPTADGKTTPPYLTIATLMGYTQLLGGLLLVPTIILVGYQVMLGASSFRQADAIQIASRVIIGVAAVAVCLPIIQMLIDLSNNLNGFIVGIHTQLPYPQLTELNVPSSYPGVGPFPMGFQLYLDVPGDTASYRGLLLPVVRWGCVANDFVSLIAEKFWGDIITSFIPFLGGLAKLALNIDNAITFIHHLAEFVCLILSIAIAVQVYMRIIFLNFYIVTCPVVFSCWGLPGGAGQNVVKSWFKGFLSILFLQGAQLFVLTVAPLIIPALPSNLGFDSWHILDTVFAQLPCIVILVMTLRVPQMLGTSAAKAIASAGTVAGGAVTAIGMTVYKMV